MNDPYVYKDTSILINNLNIKDERQLDKAESDFAIIAIEKQFFIDVIGCWNWI